MNKFEKKTALIQLADLGVIDIFFDTTISEDIVDFDYIFFYKYNGILFTYFSDVFIDYVEDVNFSENLMTIRKQIVDNNKALDRRFFTEPNIYDPDSRGEKLYILFLKDLIIEQLSNFAIVIGNEKELQQANTPYTWDDILERVRDMYAQKATTIDIFTTILKDYGYESDNIINYIPAPSSEVQ